MAYMVCSSFSFQVTLEGIMSASLGAEPLTSRTSGCLVASPHAGWPGDMAAEPAEMTVEDNDSI